jgi:hypothetical protein
MAGGTSRPRAVGDVTSVDTGSTSGSIPLKRNRGGILARIGTVCPFRGDGKNRHCVCARLGAMARIGTVCPFRGDGKNRQCVPG